MRVRSLSLSERVTRGSREHTLESRSLDLLLSHHSSPQSVCQRSPAKRHIETPYVEAVVLV